MNVNDSGFIGSQHVQRKCDNWFCMDTRRIGIRSRRFWKSKGVKCVKFIANGISNVHPS